MVSTVIVTGSNRGIGYELSHAVAKAGATTVKAANGLVQISQLYQRTKT
jgi:NAD(P)-dependent dehydrogenase (short-subunit alcohol dehydrogenase family)